jgi:hypothetical protein
MRPASLLVVKIWPLVQKGLKTPGLASKLNPPPASSVVSGHTHDIVVLFLRIVYLYVHAFVGKPQRRELMMMMMMKKLVIMSMG